MLGRTFSARWRVAPSFCLFLALPACEDALSTEELSGLQDLELTAASIPESPTNRFADDPAAAAWGRDLFFDRRMSATGMVACVDCHDPSIGFSDKRSRSEGVNGLTGGRHSMPITTAALQPFLLWDGRADTVWRQPLYAIENPREMDFTRVEVARFIAGEHRETYEAIFGPLPDLSRLPGRATPGDPAWETIDASDREAVERVFVNVGKAIEAYERKLICVDTRYDRWSRGEVELSDAELEGATRFAESGCLNCHNGPALSDGMFHNLGLSRDTGDVLDLGREEGRAVAAADPLNGASIYSDDPEAGRERLAIASIEQGVRGAFRTASLRGVGQRVRFGHLGEHTELVEFIEDTYRGRGGRGGGRGRNGRNDNDDDDGDLVGTLDPLLDQVNVNGGAAESIAVFLRTFDCPAPPPELLAP